MKKHIFFTFWTFSRLSPTFFFKMPYYFYFLVPKNDENCQEIVFFSSLASLTWT